MKAENKAKDLANKLDGREYGNEITIEESNQAKEDGLIVVFGSSDDLVEFEGAITEELNDGMLLIIPKGKKQTVHDEDEGESWEEGDENTAIVIQLKDVAEMGKNIIEAEYSGSGIWRFETELPHHQFSIYEDNELFCIGIVIDSKDLK